MGGNAHHLMVVGIGYQTDSLAIGNEWEVAWHCSFRDTWKVSLTASLSRQQNGQAAYQE